jgi:hypothetical protein
MYVQKLNVKGHGMQSLYITYQSVNLIHYQGADKSLAQPGRKQATVTEDFDFHISYL